jgi:formylglycine-generating enzyme required for sulfatase activity
MRSVFALLAVLLVVVACSPRALAPNDAGEADARAGGADAAGGAAGMDARQEREAPQESDAPQADAAPQADDAPQASDAPRESGVEAGGDVDGADAGLRDAPRDDPASSCDGSTCLTPSCASGEAGIDNCGPDGGSCCASPVIPGGTYDRIYASDADGGAIEGSAPATVSSFRLDAFDVTVARFRKFVAAWKAGWTPAAGSGKHTHLNGGRGLVNVGGTGGYEPGWLESDDANIQPTDANLACDSPGGSWTPAPDVNENLPINCINWWEAYAFCIWDGGFLPSEAEWGYAAAGGDQQRKYPWGSTEPGDDNRHAIYNCDYPLSAMGLCGPGGSVQSIAPVGTTVLGAGRWGEFDLAGNLEQWTSDWYHDYVTPCVDCANLTVSSALPYRVFRGGSFNESPPQLQSVARGFFGPGIGGFGIRCARAP